MKRVSLAILWLGVVSLIWLSPSFGQQTINLGEEQSTLTVVQQDAAGVVLQLRVGTLRLYEVNTREGIFTLLTGDGLVKSQRVGEPDLPTANRLLAIPFGCELSAEAIPGEYQEFALADFKMKALIMPAQPSLSKSDDPETVPFIYDRQLYQTPGFYRAPMVETEMMGIMRSVNLGLVRVAPFEYDPVDNKLRVYKEITVRVKFLHPDWQLTQAMQEKFYSPAFEPVYGRLCNYEYFKQQSLITADLTKYPIKYLIISDRMFQSQLQPFIQWKIKRGFKVITAYTDSIGTTNTAIRQYIQQIYNSGTPQDPAPSFVLLVGDAQQIPPFQFSGHVSDLSFCEFTGDNVPEIYYGRFSAQNTTELQPQIDKTLMYERYQMPDPSYLGRVTMIAGVDATYAPTYGNGQINYGTNNYFNAAHGLYSNTWLYPASDSAGAAAAIRATVNQGVGYINYTAHGSHDGWSDPEFSSSQVNALTNSGKYPLAVGNCCLTNTFGTNYSTPCFGEVWLQAANKGGVGYIGGSNSTYWDEDYWWAVGAKAVSTNPPYNANYLGAYDGMFHDHGEPISEHYIYNDAINFRGNLAVMQAGSSRIAYYWQIYHLMGDPSVMTYLRVPSANPVSHPQAVLLNATSVSVQAAPGSYVGISFNGIWHGAAYVGQSGTVDVPVLPFGTPGTADIVVTAQNRIPYISTFQVIPPSGPYVIYDSCTINDASGNNNGRLDHGENVILGIRLKNVGPQTAQNVQATLTSSDPYVTITDNSEYYGTIPANNGTLFKANAFGITISPSVPDQRVIVFQLTITGAALDTWNSNFTLVAHAPAINFVSMAISDPLGNGNGILDPGEAAEIRVTINNTGSARANAVIGILSENDAYITIADSNGTFGNIDSGQTATNSADFFVVSASSACLQGRQVTFGVRAIDAMGYTSLLNFQIVVGDRAVIFSDDFSDNTGWTGLGGNGEWTIGPATGGRGDDSYGGPDPSVDHSPTTDNRVLGNDLTSGTGGDYSANLSTTYWVTSPLINCSNATGVILKFWRWLGVERNTYDHAYLEVYNGTSWVRIYENPSSHVDESSWSEQTYDVSSAANNNPNFRIRFGIGPTDGSWQYCGWNIDDLEVKGYRQGTQTNPRMVYSPSSLLDSLVQGDTARRQIRVRSTGNAALRVTFSSSQSWIWVPDTIHTIPPGDSLNIPVTLKSASLGTPGNHLGSITFVSNDPTQPTGNIPVTLYIFPPDIFLAVSSLADTLQPGGQSQLPLVIVNNGSGRLNYDILASTNELRRLLVGSDNTTLTTTFQLSRNDVNVEESGLAKDKTEPYGPPVTTGRGGPDQFGHRWVDSDDPSGPAYNWVDISQVGTRVFLPDDSSAGPIPIGFSFPFYENRYDQLYIGSNGIITFGAGSTAFSNTNLPNTSTPNNLIAIWWDDLHPGAGGQIRYYYDAAANRFVVSFIEVPNYYSGSGTGSLTFQAILQPSGSITFNYHIMNPGQDADSLHGATIGIENINGTDGLAVVYNANYVHNQLAVKISTTGWLTVEPTTGTIPPYGQDTVIVFFDAGNLTNGQYNGQITVSSNDPDQPTIVLPAFLLVRQYGPQPCQYLPGDINGDDAVLGSDVTFGVRYFKGLSSGPPPDSCWNDSASTWLYAAGDVNGNCEFRGSDITLLVAFLKGQIGELHYCPWTPPQGPLRLPHGWLLDEAKGMVRLLESSQPVVVPETKR